MKQAVMIFMLIFCLPLLLWCGGNVHNAHFNVIQLAVYFIAASYIKNPYVLAFCLYAGLWALAGMFFLSPFFLAYIEACVCILFGIIIYNFVYTADIPRETIYDIICITAFFQAYISIIQFFWFDPITSILHNFVNVDIWGGGKAPGTLGNPNYIGAYMAYSLPFFIRKPWWFATPVIALCLFVTHTTAAAVAAIAGLSVFFIGWVGALLGLAFTGFILIGFSNFKASKFLSATERFELWWDAIKSIFANSSSVKTFLFGWGPGVILRKQNNLLHSQWITTFFNFGFMGIAIVIAFMIDVFRKAAWKGNALMASFMAILINMLGNHPMQLVPCAILIITIVALLQKELNFNRA